MVKQRLPELAAQKQRLHAPVAVKQRLPAPEVSPPQQEVEGHPTGGFGSGMTARAGVSSWVLPQQPGR